MLAMFVGRVQELQILGREYDRSRPSLIVVLGRRRVGKSTLLLKSIGYPSQFGAWRDILGRLRDIKDSSQLSPYVKKLEGLRLIQIIRSLDAHERQRQYRYYLDDPFLSFWYRFVLPNWSALESGHSQAVYERMIEPVLDDYMGSLFERICQEYMRLYGQELLGNPAQEVGRIWAGDFDIDVAGKLLDGSVFYGECKWWKNLVGENILDRLIENSTRTTYGKGNIPCHYLIFARQGFTTDLRARAANHPNVHLVTPEKLLGQ
jgi:uncharacterized protein